MVTATKKAGPKMTKFAKIKQEVCAKYSMTVEQFDGRDRGRIFCQARNLAWWRARQETKASLPQLGAWSGGREHTTVYHGICIFECARKGEESPVTKRKREYAKKRWHEKKARGEI
jgi:chromosomal replication initiator protein